MNKTASMSLVISTGIAIFSMFFGSGNVVFPLLLANVAGEELPWALVGLIITAVGAPLLGLLGCVLFEGDCKQFFYRIGKYPGYITVILLLALLGPIGVMPRCLIVAYGAVQPYFPDLSLFSFSIGAGIVTLLCIWRRHFILPLLGGILSPLLIISLIIIMIAGIMKMTGLSPSTYTPFTAFKEGLATGYDTMDLLASLFFSVGIWMLLKDALNIKDEDQGFHPKLISTYLWASLVGGILLAIIYVGLSLAAAAHPQALHNVAPEQALANLAIYLLGSKLAMVANLAVVLACLTTIMSLAVAVVEVIHIEIAGTELGQKIPYRYGSMMLITLIITVIFSNLGFSSIMAFLHPIMAIIYPAIIVLTICNIMYKLYGFPYVKVPVFATFIAALVWKGFSSFS